MKYNDIKRLLTREENEIVCNSVNKLSDIIITDDINLYSQLVTNIKDIFVTENEKIKLFKNSKRLFGNIHIGFIDRYESDTNIKLKMSDTKIYKNDRKAVSVMTKNIENEHIKITNKLYLYIPNLH